MCLRPQVEFLFTLLDERLNVNDLDDRLFRVSELPPGSVARLRSVWRFTNDKGRQHAFRLSDSLENAARPTSVVIRSQEIGHFLECWNVDRVELDRKDWFAYLGITLGHSPLKIPRKLPTAR